MLYLLRLSSTALALGGLRNEASEARSDLVTSATVRNPISDLDSTHSGLLVHMCYTRLSVEVIEMVVDQLSDDVPSLRTVALVCRGLLPRARYNLFVDIGVRNKNQMNTLREFLDERPYICPLVQCVTLSTTDGEPNSFTLLETIPVPLLTRLPNLRRWRATNQSLDFKGQHWLSLNHSTLASLRKYTANISHLSINALSFSGCMDFVRFVSAFSGLHSLVCEEINVKTEGVTPTMATTYQRLAQQCRLSRLIVRRDVSEAAVASLLEISKLTLRELVLVVTRQQSNSLQLLALAEQLSQLDSLTLSMPVDPHLETFVRSVWGIAAFFKYLSTMLPLQEIRVECYGSSFWALDAMLSQQGTSEACQQLEQVLLAVPRHSMQFRIVGGGRGSKPLKGNLRNMALKKRFRTLWKKGAIRVELPRSTDTAHAETTAVRGHSRPVKALLVSPDSRWVASAASDGAIILWDARRQVLSREWSAVGKVEHFVSLAFSQDSRCLASAGDHELVVWSIKDGGEVDRLDALQMEGTTIRACSWSPDDAHLAIGCTDATIHILHGRTFQELRVLRFARGARPDAAGRGPGSSVERLSFNNGRWLLSGVERLLFANARWLLSVAPDVSHGCRLWDIAAGKLRTVLRGHTASITTASFNPTGTRLATASMDHTVRIWDIDRAAPLAVLRGHTGPVLDVAFSPDGKFVLSASEDRTAKVWPASGGRCTHSFKHFNWVYAVRFSSDGRYIATASWDHTVRLFRASDGALVKRLWEHAGAHVRHLAFSPDGETLWSGADDGSVSGRRLSNIIDA